MREYVARKTKAQQQAEQNKLIVRVITIVILFAFAILGFTKAGIVGLFIYNLLGYLAGNLYWFVIAMVIIVLLINIIRRKQSEEEISWIPIILLISALLLLEAYIAVPNVTGMEALYDYINHTVDYFMPDSTLKFSGGIYGIFLYAISSMMFNRIGTVLVIIVLFMIAMLLLVDMEVYKRAFRSIIAFFKMPEVEESKQKEEPEEPKEPANLWKMIDKGKEKTGSLFQNIKADGKTESLPVVQEEQPRTARVINRIHPDDPTQEVPIIVLPGETISQKDSVFIDVDDLTDDHARMEEKTTLIQDTVVRQPEQSHFTPMTVDREEEGDLSTTEEYETVVEEHPDQESNIYPPSEAPKPKKRTRPYQLPKISLLDSLPPKGSNPENEVAAREKSQLLLQILNNFDIEAQLLNIHIGPSVTQFEIRPDVNVKVSKILGLTDNIKMQLAARDVRIEAPIPGRNAVGIEIPNVKSTPVKMREIINDVGNDKSQPLLFFLGKDLLGKTVTCRLDKMPHMLIAGATGSGKSVCMNSIICSLLLRTKPDEVKMLLVDPKKVEFTPYRNIPHLIGPVINDPNKASNALKVIVRIMDERYNMFAAAGVRNIEVYNNMVEQQGGRPNPDGSPAPKKIPYIVVIIDELADLMAVAGKEVEQSIQRITQLARAAGIHLIVATQRPSVDVITGIIKANIPSRIAFAVSSGMDSRTILDHVGAERLLGYGDMLYMPIGQTGSTRVQGVFVTDDEVQRITSFVSSEASPVYDDSFVQLDGIESGEGGIVTEISDDPLFKEIKEYVIEAQKASTSLLQRRFGIGYNRAARMIDALEEHGIIGPAQGSKPREVYIKE